MHVIVFFFEQKTAYEMRISDWSSDVCSSDLHDLLVHFIGAGPGDPDLLTIRGRDLIARCPVCLYAGSLVPVAVVAHAPAGATVVDTASLTLDEIVALIVEDRKSVV